MDNFKPKSKHETKNIPVEESLVETEACLTLHNWKCQNGGYDKHDCQYFELKNDKEHVENSS